MHCLVMERCSKAGKRSHGFRNLENEPLEPRRGWTTAQIDFEGWRGGVGRVMGGDSTCREWEKQRQRVCSHSGGQMRAAGTWREAKETREPLSPRIKLKPLGRGLETLSSVPSNDGC